MQQGREFVERRVGTGRGMSIEQDAVGEDRERGGAARAQSLEVSATRCKPLLITGWVAGYNATIRTAALQARAKSVRRCA